MRTTLVFDLDGTLAETAPDIMATLNHLLLQEGLEPLPISAARNLVGAGARALLERGFKAAGRPLGQDRLEELFQDFLVHYLDHIADLSFLFPGVEGALKALATTGAQRSPQLPDVPTMSESIPGFEYPTWIGLVAPKGLPQEVREKILSATRDVMHDPEVARRFAEVLCNSLMFNRLQTVGQVFLHGALPMHRRRPAVVLAVALATTLIGGCSDDPGRITARVDRSTTTTTAAATTTTAAPTGTAGSNIAHFTPTAEVMRTIRAQAFRAAGDGLAQTANPYRPDSRRGVIWLTFFFEARMAQEWAAEAAQPPQHEQA